MQPDVDVPLGEGNQILNVYKDATAEIDSTDSTYQKAQINHNKCQLN